MSEPIVDPASIKESVARLGTDLGDLVRAELAIFKSELRDEGVKIAAASVWLAGGALFGLAALGVFTAFLVMVISLVLQPWLSALVVTVFWGCAAGSLLAAAAIKFKAALPMTLDKTKRSVKEDITWIKSGAKPGT